MSREIKFKIWDKHKKEFIGSWSEGLRFELSTGQIYINGTNFTEYFELCQFTGLKDREGCDIYEGDLIEVFGDLCKVFWTDSNTGFYYQKVDPPHDLSRLGRYSAPAFKVIGNIYETPNY